MKVLQSQVLILAGALFTIGLIGALFVRRGVLSALLGLEIMLCAPTLVLLTSGSHWNDPEGYVMCIVMFTLSAAELAVLIVLLSRYHRTRMDEELACQPSAEKTVE